MKKIYAVFVVLVCLCSSYVYAGIAEDIAKLVPSDVDSSFIEIIEQQKNAEPDVPVANGIKVSAAVRNGELCSSVASSPECEFSWPETANYNPKAKKYIVGEYVLFHWINNGENIFYRNELPKTEVISPPKDLPKAEKPALEKEKAEMPKTPSAPVQKTEGNGVQQVYEATALPFSLKNIENQPLTAIIIPTYLSPWIGDGLGIQIPVIRDGKEVLEDLTRTTWRAYVDRELFSAVITRFGTHIFVIVPGKTMAELIEKEVVVVSGSGKFALTSSGDITEFNLKDFESKEENVKSFFEKHPSKITEAMLTDFSPNTERGKIFIEDLNKIFPNEYLVKDRMISIGTDIDTLKALVGESNNSTYLRRVIQMGGLPNISLGSVACPPCELARMLIVWTLAAFDNTLKGDFFEGNISRYHAGKAMSRYLKACQEEMAYMTKIIFSARK